MLILYYLKRLLLYFCAYNMEMELLQIVRMNIYITASKAKQTSKTIIKFWLTNSHLWVTRHCWKWLIFVMLICNHLLMNADPAGIQLCSEVIIMYEKHGTISDKIIVFMCLWLERISAKFVVKWKVPGYGIKHSIWLTNTCIKKLSDDYYKTLYWNTLTDLLYLLMYLYVCFVIFIISYHSYVFHVVS